MKRFFSRMLAMVLCLCLLPVVSVAEYLPEYPVTRSEFDFSVRLNADAFPNDGAAHYKDWETFLSKIRVKGTADVQQFLHPYGRVYADAGLYLNGKETVPFEYDNYYSDFRYFRSPALGGASVFFQFRNFYQFMMKGYYYMDLPTQLIAVPLYPQSLVETVGKYAEPLQAAFEGTGSRHVPYDRLLTLCEELNNILLLDEYDAVYYVLTCLLIDLGADSLMWDKLSTTDLWLDHLDPEQQGMTITVEDGRETWVLGETTVFEKDDAHVGLYLPDPEGYVFALEYHDFGTERFLNFLVTLEEEERLNLLVTIDGLADLNDAAGTVHVELTGGALYEEIAPMDFAYSFLRTGETVPYDLALSVDWLHPETGLPAIGASFTAALSDQVHEALNERPYDNQDDFFHLNESYMEEYKQRFLPTLALAAAPFVLEMPAGIISDAVAFMEETGILAFLGIE